ncbi:transglycosylase domain-containing protein, partial [Candidatus Uhrbacteria bacterium]|nr:transglycosylase domain-containing protein [Candidatus Uhrbacteria bacterium]
MPPKYSGYDYIYRARRPGLVRRSLSGGGFGAKRRPPTKKVLSYAVVVFVALFSAASIAGIGLFAYFAAQLPDPEKIIARSVPETTTIYDRTGKNILYQVHSGQKRTVVELDDIAPVMRQATVAIEDKRFYTDRAIDIRGIMRSVLQNIVAGRKVQGGSTITQQFIKNSILTKEKTYTRKIKELVLAYELERRFTKDQILKFYLNEIPYDSVAFGVESASQAFFGKAAKDLTLAESAMLAAVPKATTYYSPYGNHRKELTERVHLVLDLMVEQGYIGAEQAAEAKKDDVVARVLPRRESITAPHFVFYVKDALADIFGEQEVERAGLKVITTLDMTKQTLAEKILEENKDALKKWKASTAALAAIDPKTGEILTMVGSADYFDDAINGKYNALLGRLQPGSSIKPIVYAASFEKGYTPDTVLDDVATVFKSVPKDYTPSNYDGKEHGLVTARQALAGSLNIPAVKMLYLTGIDRFTDFARKLGYTTFEDKSKFGLSLVLGGAEIRPIEHIAAFSAFAQDGNLAPTKAILRVEDRDGNVLFDNTVAGAQKVFEPEIARQINSIMSDNAARAFIFGEQNYLTLGDRPVAAKTGTTNDYKDAWAIGYTPSLVTGVWVGNAKGTAMK